MGQVNIIFNSEKIQSDSNLTILELANQKGIEIPTLCHDKRLLPYGSCFLCVVEVKKAKTLMPACATKLIEGMEIETNNEKVFSARKTALELILSAHYGDCVAPCKIACPAGCDVQGYVGLIANSKYKDAIKLIKETIPFPASTGRVCPKFCEDKCRRQHVEESIAIDNLKRFVADIDLNSKSPYMPEVLSKIGKKVAIIGGGPAGLSAGYYLIQNGVDIEVFEAKSLLGGMLRYGIPQYRLPKEILDKELNTIVSLGMKIHTGKVLGKDFTIDSLKKEGFDAIILAMGAWKAQTMKIPNEDADNIFKGIKFLERIADKEDLRLHGRVAIVGGGNTAFDCARTALRLGADEVVMIYRRTKDEMPAEEIEKIESDEEGIKFLLLTAPVEVIKDGNTATCLVCRKMKLGEPDSSGRRSPVPIEGSDFKENFDFIISAIGQNPDFNILGGYKDILVKDEKKLIYNKETCQTDIDYIFAVGDYSIGAATVVEGIGEAKKAALAILKYLRNEELTVKNEYISVREDLTDKSSEYFKDWEKSTRQKAIVLSPEKRRDNFKEIEKVMSEKKALSETQRCMECGCIDVYECHLKKYSDEYKTEENKFKGFLNIYKNDDSSEYLYRDPSKCILCGRCVRLCSEKVNVGVYGYVKRGFDTIVAPSFAFPLKDSDCIQCGTCISGCPVGAIVPKQVGLKKVPLKTKQVDTYCFHCSNGCKTTVSVLNDSIYEIRERDNYLCEKGRFHFPKEFPLSEVVDTDILLNFKDAIVYPSSSLSSEDYETLKAVSNKMNWKIANYYSQSTLWQAFAVQKKLPAMDFFNSDIKEKTLVIISGDLENTNPVAINKLNELIKDDTDIIHINNNQTLRLKNIKAEYFRNIDEIKNINYDKYNEILLLVNPVDHDLINGQNSSLNLYNMITGVNVKVRTTLFSNSRNIYSFYDSDKIIKDDLPRKIFIHTIPGYMKNKYIDKKPSIILTENFKEIFSIPLNFSISNKGTFLNSKNEYYKNNPVFEESENTIPCILGINKIEILNHENIANEKPMFNKFEPIDFPDEL